MGGGLATGLQVSDSSIELTTVDAPLFRANVAKVCKHYDARLFELSPLDEDLESVFRYLVS